MTQTKYFQKLKCKCSHDGSIVKTCWNCKGSGFIKGADITSTIKPILEGIENNKRSVEQFGYGAFNNALEKAKQIIEENVIKVE